MKIPFEGIISTLGFWFCWESEEPGKFEKGKRRNPWKFLFPARFFFTNGAGMHKEELRSFELALRDAGIEKANLVHVSSILPPRCRVISRSRGLQTLVPGAITYCVMARCSMQQSRTPAFDRRLGGVRNPRGPVPVWIS